MDNKSISVNAAEESQHTKSVSLAGTGTPSMQYPTVNSIGPGIEKGQTQTFDKYAIDCIDSSDSQSISVRAETETSWANLTTGKRVLYVLEITLKVICALLLLYFFICCLDLVSVGFVLMGGSEPQKFLRADILGIPVVGLMCGILFTIVVQSSSTTTSTVVGMVAGKIIDVRSAIPIIMGANIGTSVTSTLLAMTQAADRNQFRRAFAAATVHDMFNWLTTLVLLPFETMTGYLYFTTRFIVQEISTGDKTGKSKNLKLLKALTEPLTMRIVKLDKNVTNSWSFPITNRSTKSALTKQGHLFAGSTWSDRAIGAVVVLLSFGVLLLCLFLLVKTLKSILKGRIAIWIRHLSNANLPHCPKMTDYILILIAALLTFLLQSSSAFTSTLPPLVAVKALSLERAYTLTLGANIGTTTTALLAALAQSSDGRDFNEAIQIALCHLLFNLTGMMLFFPIPCTRFPIQMAKVLGNITARYRWFAILYVLVLFILLPLLFMALAFAGRVYVIIVAVLLLFAFIFIVSINSLRKYPRFLPKVFHTWNWLPEWIRSLEPYDRAFTKCACCHKLLHLSKSSAQDHDSMQKKDESDLMNS